MSIATWGGRFYSLRPRVPMRTFSGFLVAASLLVGAPLQAQYTTFTGRTTFESFLTNRIVDDFAIPPYNLIQSDAAMSAVVGETQFTATGFAGLNLVWSGRYCNGCDGSFRMGFAGSSLSGGTGVFGVGFDFFDNKETLPYLAYVTFGDGSTANLGLGAGSGFFGLTSTAMIASIHVGLQNGGASTAGYISIDNLTLGSGQTPPQKRLFRTFSEEPLPTALPQTSAPEPASVALMAAGMLGLGAAQWRRRRRGTDVATR
jgi:hypothetical protein